MARAIKFNQTQIKIALGYATQTVTPSKIERTDPRAPVFTSAKHGLATGDVIFLSGTDYSTASGYFSVAVSDENTFTVSRPDFSLLSASDLAKLVYAKAEMSGLCEAKDIDITPFSVDYENVTTNCDEVSHEEGTVKAGEGSMNIYWSMDKELHLKLEEMGQNQTDTYFQFRQPKGKRVRGYQCTVSAFSYSGEADSNYSGRVGVKFQSLKHDVLLP